MFTDYNWVDAVKNFFLSLKVMGLGMLSIFSVILILFIAVLILGKLTNKK